MKTEHDGTALRGYAPSLEVSPHFLCVFYSTFAEHEASQLELLVPASVLYILSRTFAERGQVFHASARSKPHACRYPYSWFFIPRG